MSEEPPGGQEPAAPDGAPGAVPDAALDAAFLASPRVDFLPRAQRQFAPLNLPLAIGAGQTCSQPSTVRRMLELLDVLPGQRVLDVGAGSGWTTALLARLVGPAGSVVGVEIEPTLAGSAGERLAAAGLSWARVELVLPGRLGWPGEAPYDRVLVSAEADEVPGELLAQLAPDAVMVLPVAGVLTRMVTRGRGGSTEVSTHGHVLFVPLR